MAMGVAGNCGIGRRGGRMAAAGAFCAAVLCTAAPAPAAPKLPRYETPYYIIYTDLEPNTVREAYARLTAMAEEYHNRTKGFTGAIRRKFSFYLFSKAEDYYDAGGLPGSAGVYTGARLMAMATPGMRGHLWHVLQHEGFHQFAHAMISRRLPIWANEGMAEYFGHAIWTGDGMVSGIIPPTRMRRVQSLIRDKQTLRFSKMLDMSNQEWNDAMSTRNYDQAWSMVHFLVHGDNGKYVKAFTDHINDISRGQSVALSFERRFGRDDRAFQARYEQWWTSLPANPTADNYTEAVVATLTSFLARARFLKMEFDKAEEFFKAAGEGKIQIDGAKHPRLWLPQSLVQDTLKKAPGLGEWSLGKKGNYPTLILTQADGATFTGAFKLPTNRHPEVLVELARPKPAPSSQPAKTSTAPGR